MVVFDVLHRIKSRKPLVLEGNHEVSLYTYTTVNVNGTYLQP